MAFCTNCGAKLEDGQRFCCNCGSMVAQEAPVSEAPVCDPQESLAYANEPVLSNQEGLLTHQNEAPEVPEAQPDYDPIPEAVPTQDSAQELYADEAPAAKPHRPRRKFLTGFCSVLICILLVALMIPTFTLLIAQNLPKQETLLSAMDRIDMDEVPADTLMDDSDLEDVSLAEYICDVINSDMENLNDVVISYRWNDLTPKTLDRFLSKTTFLQFFAQHIEGAVDALLAGDDSYTISNKSIKRLLEENQEYIVDEMGVSVSDREYNSFVSYLVSDGLEIDDIEMPEMDDTALDIVNFLLSIFGVIALCVVLLLLILLLFVTNKGDRLFALHDTGVCFIVGSGIFLLITLAARILAAVFVGENPWLYLGSILVGTAVESILFILLGVLGAGVILLLINYFIRKYQSKRAAKAAA